MAADDDIYGAIDPLMCMYVLYIHSELMYVKFGNNYNTYPQDNACLTQKPPNCKYAKCFMQITYSFGFKSKKFWVIIMKCNMSHVPTYAYFFISEYFISYRH